jgi:aminoglycoside 6'-N-acetyltransferase
MCCSAIILIMTAAKLTFRPLKKSDFAQFAAWLAVPHVAKWWREPPTVEHVAKEYGACTEGDFKTRVYVVQSGEKAIGIIQTYRLEDYPDWAKDFPLPGAVSIDYLIGELEYTGRGVGPEMIRQFIDDVIRAVYPDATGVATSAELENHASLGALRKVGFVPGEIIQGDDGPERVMLLPFQ